RVGGIAGSEQGFFLGGVAGEGHRALWFRLGAREARRDLGRRGRAGAVVVRPIRDRIDARPSRMSGAECGQSRVDRRLLLGGGLLTRVIGTLWTHEVIPDPDRVVVHGPGEPDVVV